MEAQRSVALIGALFVALAATSSGQAPAGVNFRIFKLADGLAESACMSVTVGHRESACEAHRHGRRQRIGGYAISVIPAPVEGNSRVYGSPGGQLWTVSRQGLQEFMGGGWVSHPVPEIATEFRTGMPRILDPVPLYPVRQGQVLLLLPDRLLEFNSESADQPRTQLVRRASDSGLGRFSSMAPARDGGAWITGARGWRRFRDRSGT